MSGNDFSREISLENELLRKISDLHESVSSIYGIANYWGTSKPRRGIEHFFKDVEPLVRDIKRLLKETKIETN